MTESEKPHYYRPKGRFYLYPAAPPGGKSPFTQGTFWDLEADGIKPLAGMRLPFYADDGNDKGEPDYLLFTGVIGRDADGWHAIIDDGSFSHESDLAADPSN